MANKGAHNSAKKELYASASSQYPYILSVSWTESDEMNINNNTTTISLSGTLDAENISYASSNGRLELYWYDSVRGKSTLVKKSTDFQACGQGYGKRSVSGTITVTHDVDGTLSGYGWVKYVLYSGQSTFYTPPSSYVRTNSTRLQTIPQVATISSISGDTLGELFTVKINRKTNQFTHKVDYCFADEDERDPMWISSDAGDSVTFTPSINLASKIPNSSTGKLTVRVGTYKANGDKVGYFQRKTVNVKVPSNMVPTMNSPTATLLRTNIPSTWNDYVQGFSGVKIQINGAKGTYGSTIKKYSIVGSGINASSSSASCSTLKSSGQQTYTCEITDSRGRKAKKTVAINVLPYRAPSALIKNIERCLVDGTPSPDGTYAKVTVSYSIDSLNGNNKVDFKEVVANGYRTSQFESDVPFVFDCRVAIDTSYRIEFELADSLTRLPKLSDTIKASTRMLNFGEDKKSACFGGFAKKIGLTIKWITHFENDIYVKNKKIEFHDWTNVTYKTGFKTYTDYPVQVKRQGDVVSIRGVCSNTKTQTFNETPMFTLPEWARPNNFVNSIQQGSGANRYLMTISATGDVLMDRYTDSTSVREQTDSGSWINCFFTYII